jgi:hypothetical protein
MNGLLKLITAATIFARPNIGDQPLKDFATRMFGWLGIHTFQEDFGGRDGDEQVFVGSAVGITVVIETNGANAGQGAHKTNLEKYPFKITLAAQDTRQAADYLVQHAHVLAWRLSHEGYRCFIPKDLVRARSEQDGMIYDA